MAAIEVIRPHTMGLEKARQAVQAVAEQLQGELNARHAWKGDVLVFDCPGAEGRISVAEKAVQVSVELSWLLKPARGRIEKSINETLDKHLV